MNTWSFLVLLILIACAALRKAKPSPVWTAGAVLSFIMFVLLFFTPVERSNYVRQFDRVYELSGRELGRMVRDIQPNGPILVIMEHDAFVNQERLKGLRRELNHHGLRIQDVVVIPTTLEQLTFPSGNFEEHVKSKGYGAVISFYGLPDIAPPNADEWPPIVAYFPNGDSSARSWMQSGILRGGLAPNTGFVPQNLDETSDDALLRNHYRILDVQD